MSNNYQSREIDNNDNMSSCWCLVLKS